MKWSVLFFFCLSVFANAETIKPVMSTKRVEITSNFTGTRLALFTVIERDAQTVSRNADYDAVVRVSGPAEDITVRQKGSVLGFWLNKEMRRYPSTPSYLKILSSKPVDDITTAQQRIENKLKLNDLILITQEKTILPGDLAFKNALLRNKEQQGLYAQIEDGITFLDERVFVAYIDLPSSTPIGQYLVEAYVYAGQSFVGAATESFEVQKTGFEQRVYTLAKESPLLYGLISILLAVSVGGIGWFLFKKS